MGKEHPPPSSMRKLGFVMAELAIIGTIIVLLIYLTKYKGPLATLDVPKYNYYQYHAVLNTVAFVGFMFNAIMAFRMFPGSHKMRKGVHLFLHTCAFACSATAVYLIWQFHGALKLPNLYSVHSVVGMAAIVMFGLQWCAGVIGFVFPMTPGWMRFMALPIHKFLGIAVFVAVTVACALGAMDRQRITWETGVNVPYTAPTDKWANGFACCVLASALLVGFVMNEASKGLARKPGKNIQADDGYRSLSVDHPVYGSSA